MSNIILSERTYAQQAMENRSLGSNPVQTLMRVAKLHLADGHNKRETAGLLEDFLIACDPSTNIVRWQGVLDTVVKRAVKYPLIEVEGVGVTEKELSVIREVGEKKRRYQRLLFAMLCLAKYGNAVNPENHNWVNRPDRELLKLSNVDVPVKRLALMLNDLWKMELIGYSRVIDNMNINVKFVDDDGEPAVLVTDFRNLGNQFMMLEGEPYMECQCCGLVIRRNSNAQKYCPECCAEVDRKRRYDAWHRAMCA